MSKLLEAVDVYKEALRLKAQQQMLDSDLSPTQAAHLSRILGDELPDDVEIMEQTWGRMIHALTVRLRIGGTHQATINFHSLSETVSIGSIYVPFSTEPFWTDARVVRAFYLILR